MGNFTAEFDVKGAYGTRICTANTIDDLINVLLERGYMFYYDEARKIINWSKTEKKKYYGGRLTIRRGQLEMTEYTSF